MGKFALPKTKKKKVGEIPKGCKRREKGGKLKGKETISRPDRKTKGKFKKALVKIVKTFTCSYGKTFPSLDVAEGKLDKMGRNLEIGTLRKGKGSGSIWGVLELYDFPGGVQEVTYHPRRVVIKKGTPKYVSRKPETFFPKGDEKPFGKSLSEPQAKEHLNRGTSSERSYSHNFQGIPLSESHVLT